MVTQKTLDSLEDFVYVLQLQEIASQDLNWVKQNRGTSSSAGILIGVVDALEEMFKHLDLIEERIGE